QCRDADSLRDGARRRSGAVPRDGRASTRGDHGPGGHERAAVAEPERSFGGDRPLAALGADRLVEGGVPRSCVHEGPELVTTGGHLSMSRVLLQNWTTVMAAGAAPIRQSAEAWLDVRPFVGATLWLEVRSVTNPPSGAVHLAYETAP